MSSHTGQTRSGDTAFTGAATAATGSSCRTVTAAAGEGSGEAGGVTTGGSEASAGSGTDASAFSAGGVQTGGIAGSVSGRTGLGSLVLCLAAAI
jgi:hypothetical protein